MEKLREAETKIKELEDKIRQKEREMDELKE